MAEKLTKQGVRDLNEQHKNARKPGPAVDPSTCFHEWRTSEVIESDYGDIVYERCRRCGQVRRA